MVLLSARVCVPSYSEAREKSLFSISGQASFFFRFQLDSGKKLAPSIKASF